MNVTYVEDSHRIFQLQTAMEEETYTEAPILEILN
jgi:hypothetical protein